VRKRLANKGNHCNFSSIGEDKWLLWVRKPSWWSVQRWNCISIQSGNSIAERAIGRHCVWRKHSHSPGHSQC
jgi:hypothetical protein